jgi:hypothetical protein
MGLISIHHALRVVPAMAPTRVLLVGLLLAGACAYAVPELFRDRIFPYDGAVHASNGALFLSLFSDLPRVKESPMAWLYEYYHQYPGLSVRRHPPLFGLVEGGVYSITGVSVVGGKLTMLLFTMALAGGVYFMTLQFWKSDLVAFLTSLLLLTTPQVLYLMRTIHLDIPSLAFASWGLYFYGRWLDTGRQRWPCLLLIVLFMTLSLYTYQFPMFIVAGMFLHLLTIEGSGILRNRRLVLAGALFLMLLTPLAIHQFYLARDNVGAAIGEDTFPGFTPEKSKLTLAYWTYYAKALLNEYPVQAIGIVVWALLAVHRRPSSPEVLFALCFTLSYVGLSWMPVKGPRYMMVCSFAAAPLTVLAARDVFQMVLRERPVWRTGALAGLLIVAFAAQALLVPVPPTYLTGMDKPVEAILARQPDARILYSGDFDAAFIFYLRKADSSRQARVYRTTVQVEDPNELASFLQQERIDVIVCESEVLPQETALKREFHKQLKTYVVQNKSFIRVGECELLLGQPGKEKPFPVAIYARSGSLADGSVARP